jgi:SAM-dependent methyltransferase
MAAEDATVAARWRADLESWAIPQEILDGAPESPWGFPVSLFANRADATRQPTPSDLRALEALPQGGSVLDVGCGAGASSLPLVGRAGELSGVDGSAGMLAAFRERVEAAGVACGTIEGTWPDVAGTAPVADVVVCHHVAYNVPDPVPFVRALTAHARRIVVLEMTAVHPLSNLNDLWLRFHGLERPTRPTADDFADVLAEAGVAPERRDWEPVEWVAGFTRREELVAFVRRRLCLTADRDPEIWAELAGRVVERDGTIGLPPRPNVTVWWEGLAAGH